MTDPGGIALHIGLNAVDAAHYQGWGGSLEACEADAADMHAITSGRGFSSSTLLTRDATAANVTAAIHDAAGRMHTGDLFVLSYSGHGGQVKDTSGDEPDFLDETWVLWDRQLIDDELFALWGEFPAGARILVISDSCHSGSVVRDAFYAASPATVAGTTRFRYMPRSVQDATYRANRSLYDAVQGEHPQGDQVPVAAAVVLLSGCQDNQYSRDGDRNGLFTEQLRAVWDDGRFTGDHRALFREISQRMPPDQTPNYFRVGQPDKAFERLTPFTI